MACRRFKGTLSYDKVAELIALMKLSKIIKTKKDNEWTLFKYDSDTGRGERYSALIQNIEVLHDNIEDGDGDDENVLTLSHFPKSSEEFEELLPNHEWCATHTHIIFNNIKRYV